MRNIQKHFTNMAGRAGFVLRKLFANSVHNPLRVSERGFKRGARIISQRMEERRRKYNNNLDEKEILELTKRSNFIEWNYSSEVFAFGKRLHENFTPESLVRAFTHKSYLIKEEEKLKEVGVATETIALEDNEKFASEGEKIILDYVPNYVSHFFPRFPLEGIESVTEYLSSDAVLGTVSKNLGTTFLILSAEYPVQLPTFAKTLKAIIGALNECQGLERARLFVRDFIVTQLATKDINDFLILTNSLETLTDILKRDGREAPEPRIICQSAVNTILANYHVGIYCNKELIGHCSGESIDTAIEMAAFDALKRLFHTTDSCSPIRYDLDKMPTGRKNLKLSEWKSSAFGV